MPLIHASRAGTCTACGGLIRKAEQAWFTRESGLRHVEPVCRTAATTSYRTNARAGTCTCGTHVPAGQGRLVHRGSTRKGEAFRQIWAVECLGCAAR